MARYIDADEAKKDLDERGFDFFTSEQDINEAKRWLDEQATVDVAPIVKAHWDDTLDGITPYCSACGRTHRCFNRTPDYCPNCGAKMDEEVEE